MNKLLVICGPTATGKTKLAAYLAKKFHGELVSADSRQVYRGMDLVTGKDRPDVPIWLYDVVDPDEEFSVSLWVKLAKLAIADIEKRNKLPIIVGGTGLYIKALMAPFGTINIPPNMHVRKRLNTLSVGELQQMVVRGQMNNSDWNNPRRLIRKIEITNFKRGPLAMQRAPLRHYDYLMIGLTAEMPALDSRIDERLTMRNQMGLEIEAASLLARYDKNLPSMSAVGLNEHAYARRQMRWFRKMPDIIWYDIGQKQFALAVEKQVRTWYTSK